MTASPIADPADFRVLLVYPNTMMATLVPLSISTLYPVLKDKGYGIELFDATYYKTEEISFEQKKAELLQVKNFDFAAAGVKFKTTDMFEDFREQITRFKPHLLAITIVENTFPLALQLLESVRDLDVPVIAGGIFVSNVPEELIAVEDIDMICLGEGEQALPEVCERLRLGEDCSDIANLWVKKDGEIIKNPLRPLIRLDDIPFADYDAFEPQRLFRPMYGEIKTMIHVELERGCPYNCTYCETPQLRELYKKSGHGNYGRRKSPARIKEELLHLVEKYSPDYINFNAESFLARPLSELEELAALYTDIGLPFWCQTRPETISEDKIRVLKEMGCDVMQFGIECGNEEFRAKVLNRHHPNSQLVDNLHIVEKYGIRYTVNNIIGFPDETRELIFETIELNRLVSPGTINCYIFTPFKGTALYKYCVEKGYLGADAEVYQLLDGAPLKMDSISYDELKGLQRTFSLYVRMPKSKWPEIERAERFDEEGNKVFAQLKDEYNANY